MTSLNPKIADLSSQELSNTKNGFLGMEKMRKHHKNVIEMRNKLQLCEGGKNDLLEPPNHGSIFPATEHN